MEIINYDEVYAYLSEKNFENKESLMIDIEANQLLGENAFVLDVWAQNMRVSVKQKNKTKRVAHPINPIRL